MKVLKGSKHWLMALGVTVISGTTLIATMGCSDDYRTRPTTYRTAVYYDPYDYYYYPSLSVYFHISSGHYYYREGPHWRRVRTLPSRFHLDRHDRVRTIIKTDRPYLHHKQHTHRYKPNPSYRRDRSRDQVERKYNVNRHNNYRNNRQRRR